MKQSKQFRPSKKFNEILHVKICVQNVGNSQTPISSHTEERVFVISKWQDIAHFVRASKYQVRLVVKLKPWTHTGSLSGWYFLWVSTWWRSPSAVNETLTAFTSLYFLNSHPPWSFTSRLGTTTGYTTNIPVFLNSQSEIKAKIFNFGFVIKKNSVFYFNHCTLLPT